MLHDILSILLVALIFGLGGLAAYAVITGLLQIFFK